MTTLTQAPDAPLSAVEWRVDGKPSGAKARFVPYLNAPTVARLLDQWVGAANWKDDYEPAAGKGLWAVVSIRVEDEWVPKKDIGVPSNFEGEKGQVSDAFKRAACLKWGVGRNVYDLPTLWAPCRVDQKGNAWPTDDTLPHITKQLKALGIEANGGTVAAYHDDETPSNESVTSNNTSRNLESESPNPSFLHGWASQQEQDAAHDDLRERIASASETVQADMRAFRKAKGFGWPMPADDLDVMLAALAELTGAKTPEEKRAARAVEVAEESGSDLAKRAAAMAAKRAAGQGTDQKAESAKASA